MLILYPVEGLANRMRAIDSAIRWSRETGIRCQIRWWRDNRLLDARWGDLFQPLPQIREASDKANKRFQFFFKLKRHSSLFRGILGFLDWAHILRVYSPDDWEALREMAAKKKRYLWAIAQSYSVFWWPDGEKFQSELFRLTYELQQNVTLLTKSFGNNTIGVHIRRTDHQLAIAGSPIEAFVGTIQRELEHDHETTFFVCSDDCSAKEHLISVFGNEHIILPSGTLSRNTVDGVKQAVVELFSLASTRKIIGSAHSSFSSMGGYLGEIPVIRA